MSEKRFDLSIVVPTYNRAEFLPESIQAWCRQTGSLRYEVLWVDDGSSDETARALTSAEAASPDVFRYLRLPRSGSPSMPRNKGIEMAASDIVVTLDDDIVPDDDFVFRHWQFHQEHPAENMGAVGELYLGEEDLHHPMALFSSFPYAELHELTSLDFLHFWAGNMSFKKAFMLRNGMYRVDQQLPLLEDMECGYRMMRKGFRLVFHPTARGRHMIHRLTPQAVAAKGYRTGQSQRRLLQLVPEVSIMRRFGILSSQLGFSDYVGRVLRRLIFRIVDNPVTAALLLSLGARSTRRSAISDLYYRLIFRRNMVAGYRDALRAGGSAGSDFAMVPRS